MLVSGTLGANSSSRLSDTALDSPLKVLRKFDAWQFQTSSFLKHVEEKTELAEKARFKETRRCSMLKSQVARAVA